MSPSRHHARELLLHVDRGEGALPSLQLEAQLRSAIVSGALAPGERLPSSRVLAEDVGVSRGVVSRVYAALALEGYLAIHQGSVPTVRITERFVAPVSRLEAGALIRYDLRAHAPDVSTFPRRAWIRSLSDSLTRARDADLGYSEPAGMLHLRVEVANYLARARGVVVEPGRVIITSGSSHSLSLVARSLVRHGMKRFAFENPSAPVLREIVAAADGEVAPVAVDEHGIRVSEISDVRAVVVSPAYQFPTGVSMTAERRRGLVDWAKACAGLIVEDDYDGGFRYDRVPVAALQHEAPDQIIYVGSTGKTLVPALRLGWMVLPAALIEDVSRELFSTVLHVSGIDQLALADFMRRGEFDRHLRRMRGVYRNRRSVLVEALARSLPDLKVSGAGLHVVVDMECREIADRVCARARAGGIAIETLAQHAFGDGGAPAGLVLGFGSMPEASLKVVARAIARLIDEESGRGDLRASAA